MTKQVATFLTRSTFPGGGDVLGRVTIPSAPGRSFTVYRDEHGAVTRGLVHHGKKTGNIGAIRMDALTVALRHVPAYKATMTPMRERAAERAAISAACHPVHNGSASPIAGRIAMARDYVEVSATYVADGDLATAADRLRRAAALLDEAAELKRDALGG